MLKRRELGELNWHADGWSVVFHGDDEFLVVDEGEVALLSVATGQSRVIWEPRYLTYHMVNLGDNRFVTAESNHLFELRLIDGQACVERLREIPSDALCTISMAFSPETRQIACSMESGECVLIPADDMRSGKAIDVELRASKEDNEQVYQLSWSKNLKCFLGVSKGRVILIQPDGSVRRIEIGTGTLIAAADSRNSRCFVIAVADNDDVTLYAAAYATPAERLWEIHVKEAPPRGGWTLASASSASSAVEEIGSDILFGCNSKLLRVSEAGEVKHQIPFPRWTHSIAISPNEALVAVSTNASGTYVFDRDGNSVQPTTCHSNDVDTLCFSNDESRLYSLARGSAEIMSWSTQSAERDWVVWASGGIVWEMFLAPDDRLLISHVWRESNEYHSSISAMDRDGKENPLFECQCTYFSFLDDSTFVGRLEDNEGQLHVCDYPSGHIQKIIPVGDYNTSALAVLNGFACIVEKYHTWLVYLNQGVKKTEIKPPIDEEWIGVLFDSEDSLCFISKSAVFRYLITKAKWKQVAPFDSVAMAVGDMVNGVVPIGFENRNVELRSIRDWSVVQTVPEVFNDSRISACTLSPSGKLLAVGAWDGRMMLCELD